MFLDFHTMHESPNNVWLLDSGSSNCMTGKKSVVANLDQSVKIEVKLATEKTVDVDGKGVVNILTKKGEPKTILEVYYVPGLKHNLISVGQLTIKYTELSFRGKSVTYDKSPSKQLIEKVKMMRNKLFPLIMNYSDHVSSFTVTCSNDYQL